MVFPNHLLSHSTWQRVGLGTSLLMFGLGAWALIAPSPAANSLGIEGAATEEGRKLTHKAMQFLGIRDVAVAVSLLWFHQERNSKAMGVLLTSWILVCVTDTWIAAHGVRGFDSGIWALCGGAAVMAFVGLGLLQS